jgi:hypothetical protein
MRFCEPRDFFRDATALLGGHRAAPIAMGARSDDKDPVRFGALRFLVVFRGWRRSK